MAIGNPSLPETIAIGFFFNSEMLAELSAKILFIVLITPPLLRPKIKLIIGLFLWRNNGLFLGRILNKKNQAG